VTMAAAAMRTAFGRIGLSNNAAMAITNEQGVDSCDVLKTLTEGEIEEMCKQVRKNGGANGGGVPISAIAQSNLKYAAFLGKHNEKISRGYLPLTIDAASILVIKEYYETEKNYENKLSKPKVDLRDMTKTFEDVDEYLRACRGDKSKIPLSYVIRKEEAVTASADDPPTNYDSIEDEMEARAPHYLLQGNGQPHDPVQYHRYYREDNKQVYDLLVDVFEDTPTLTYLKPFSRTKNGRAAYMAAYEKCLGPAAIDVLATAASKALETASYKGDSRTWNFDKYVNLHVKNHKSIII